MTGRSFLVYLTLGVTSLTLFKCTQQPNQIKGKLYIIGGGKRPNSMIEEIINISGLRQKGYMVVLPIASEEPDSAAYYALKQFTDKGIEKTFALIINKSDSLKQWWIDTLKKASLIYISSGNQNIFMDIIGGTPLQRAIIEAYQNGAVIAETSAGAAVMSKLMITGKQLVYSEEENYRHIVPHNIEIGKGLDLIKSVIIDQHFIKRQRMNRLISVSKNPSTSAQVPMNQPLLWFLAIQPRFAERVKLC